MNFREIVLVFMTLIVSLSFASALTIDVNSITNDNDIEAEIDFSTDATDYSINIGEDINEDICTSYSPRIENSTTIIVFDELGETPVSGTTYTIIVCEKDENDEIVYESEDVLYDTTAPTSLKISVTDPTNSKTPEFTLEATDPSINGGFARLSCDDAFGAGEYKEIALTGASTKTTAFDITKTDYEGKCDSDEGERTVYAKFRDAAGNWASGIAEVDVEYDKTKPDEPTGLRVKSVDSEEVTLEWDEAEDNDVESVLIEFGLEGDFDEEETIDYDEDELEYTLEDLENGEEYTFRIRFIDEAGNESSASDEVEAVPADVSATITVKRGTENVTFTKANDTLTIACSYSEDVDEAIISYKYEGESTKELASDEDTDSITATIKISGEYDESEEITFYCENDDGKLKEKTIDFDAVAPSVTITDTNTIYIGVKKIQATVTETNLNTVTFTVGTTNFTPVKSGNNYSYDFNSKAMENGPYTLTVKAIDKAGNEKTATLNITISNELTAKQTAEKAISDAKAKKKVVEDTIKYLGTQGIKLNNDLKQKKDQADLLVVNADKDLLAAAYPAAKTKADQAKTIYDEVNSKATAETKETKNYDSQEGELSNALRGLGFSEEIAKQAEADSNQNTRKLKIVKVNGEYQATIELTIANNTSKETIKVLEMIPKEFAQKASEIFSDTNFNILAEDPVIEFVVTIPKGTTKTISYGTGVITEQKANDLISQNVIANFSSAPVTLPKETNTEKIVESSGTQQLIIMAGLAILVLLIIAGIIVGVVMLTKGHGFGGSSSSIDKKDNDVWPKK